MPRGNYNVQDGMDVETGKQAQRDSSYRACLHAMLIFIAICIILLVAAWPWNNHRAASDKTSNTTSPISAAREGEENPLTTRTSTQRPSSTPKSTTSTTTRRTTTQHHERHPIYTVVAVTEKEEIPTTQPVSSTTTKTTTEQYERRPLYTVVAVTEKEEDIPTSTTKTSTTTEAKVEQHAAEEEEEDWETTEVVGIATTKSVVTETEEPLEANKGLPVTPETETTETEESQTINAETEVFYTTPVDGEERQERYESESTPADIIDTIEDHTSPPTTPPATAKSDTVLILTNTTVTEAVTEAVVVEVTEAVTNTTVTEAVTEAVVVELTEAVTEATAISSTTSSSSLVCETSHCKTLASRMLSLMNHGVDPCDDFYEHACGGLRSNPNLLDDDPSRDVYDRIRRGLNKIDEKSCNAKQKFKRYYDICVQNHTAVPKEQRIAEARKIIESVGNFNDIYALEPVLIDLTDIIIGLMKYHSTPMFDLMLDVDGNNPSNFALKLTAPVFKPMFRPLDRREDCHSPNTTITNLNTFYENYKKCKNDRAAYLDELTEAMEELEISVPSATVTDIRWDMEYELFIWLENRPHAGEMQKALTGKQYDLMTISALIKEFPRVEWGVLIKALLNRDLPEDTHVQVYFKDYLIKMFDIFGNLTHSKKQNVLLGWLAHDIYVDLVLTRDSCTREAYCLRVASDLMEDVSSSLYLSTFTHDELVGMRTEAEQLFTQLRDTLRTQLYEAAWLDDSSKSTVISKLNNLTLTVDGGISVFLNDTFLNDRMKKISLQENSYITLSASLLKRYRRQMYALCNVNPSEPKAMWSQFLLPYSTQGIVVYALKNVVIPYGMMTRPMYEPDLPRYLLMARLGFVIAHEMAHHFDVNGMTYGPDGRGDNLLSHKSHNSFLEITSCPKDGNSFKGDRTADDGRSISFEASEDISLNERIADRMAAALGYETYLAWVRDSGAEPKPLPYMGLSNEKVYFLAIAQIFCAKTTILDYGVSLFEDEHPPPFLRVNTIMDNSYEFPGVFQCKSGDIMNPVNDVKCEAFPKLTPLQDEVETTASK